MQQIESGGRFPNRSDNIIDSKLRKLVLHASASSAGMVKNHLKFLNPASISNSSETWKNVAKY